MYLVLASFCCSLLITLLQSNVAVGDPLMGDVAAADPSLSAVASNPAAAAFLDRTQISWTPELFKSETIYARYPGFESASLAVGIVIFDQALLDCFAKTNRTQGLV